MDDDFQSAADAARADWEIERAVMAERERADALKRCKTCKHWESPHPAADIRHGGLCSHPKLRESYGQSSYEEDALVYPYNEGAAGFWAGPEFGCVHHEEAALSLPLRP